MKLSGKVPCLLFLMGLVNLTFGQNQIRWPLVVEPPNQAGVEIGHFYNLPKDKISFTNAAGGYTGERGNPSAAQLRRVQSRGFFRVQLWSPKSARR